MSRKYKSELLGALHESVESLHEQGLVDKITMREFDETCLTAVKAIPAVEIRQIRKQERMSQSVFARYLNVSSNLVSEWERGVKKPGGPALRLLSVIRS